jgi:hypothetical protein
MLMNRRRVWAAPAKHAILTSVSVASLVASLGGGLTDREVLRFEVEPGETLRSITGWHLNPDG